MKNLLIDFSMESIRKQYPEYSKEKLEEIKYGLLIIYLTFSKLIIISVVAMLLGIFKEFIIFTVFYIFIRMTSFGLHATKSWICLLTSTISFIAIPIICKSITIPINLLVILGFIGILLIYKNSPADTEKKPIISPIRRRNYKIISTIIAIIMVIMSIVINNSFISNALIMALLMQCFMISPFAYKLFKLPYDNYKKYINKV